MDVCYLTIKYFSSVGSIVHVCLLQYADLNLLCQFLHFMVHWLLSCPLGLQLHVYVCLKDFSVHCSRKF